MALIPISANTTSVQGTSADDTFAVASGVSLSAAMAIHGAGGRNRLNFTGRLNPLYGLAFSKCSNLQLLDFSTGANGATAVLDSRAREAGLQLVKGSNKADTLNARSFGTAALILEGQDGDDSIWSGEGPDSIKGGTGTDFIDGGNGGDTLEGGDQSDVINGGDGDDHITGIDPLDPSRGKGCIDLLTGGIGNDSFILGDRQASYYTDGNTSSAGANDYAYIRDFSPGDTIILKGKSSDYILKLTYPAIYSIYQNDSIGAGCHPTAWDSKDDLIAMVQVNSNGFNLSLSNAAQFSFL